MNSELKKKIIIVGIAIIVSVIIWNINASWGNTFFTCLILSTTTFLIIYTPFEIYYNIRLIWFERWKSVELEDLLISKVKITTEGGFLVGNVIKSQDQEKIHNVNSFIIFNHGFSDNKNSHQYLLYPLALRGYVVLSYDARGTCESKQLGQRVDFLSRKRDFIAIVDWISKEKPYSKMKLTTIGFSIGALISLTAGFKNRRIDKLIAISCIANYSLASNTLNPIFKISYYLNRVNLNPSPEENYELSPALIIEDCRQTLSEEEWSYLSNRVYLIHNKNDRVIKFENFEVLRNLLELTDENVFVSKFGGHSHQKNEIKLVAVILKFLESNAS